MASYYIGNNLITSPSVGVSIERYATADHWHVRLYVQDAFQGTVLSYILSNPTGCAIKVSDTNNTVSFTGTVVRWESSSSYSFVDVWNATCSVS